MKYNMAVGVGSSGKAVQAISGGAYRPKRVVSGKQFSSIWSELRNGLDALAETMGIPLKNLRQQFRNEGIDPDRYERTFDRILLENPGAVDDDGLLNEAMAQAEDASRTIKPSVLLIGGFFLLMLIMRR